MGEENNLEPERTEPNPNATEGMEGSSREEPAPSAGAKGLTPGQRLAAKKAQKAQKKKEFKDELKRKDEEEREKELEEAQRFLAPPPTEPALPEEVQKVAGDFTDFVQTNRFKILGGVAALLALAFAVIFGQKLLHGGSAEQAKLLASAIETSSALISPTETDGKTDTGKPAFTSREERDKKAIEAYAAVAKKDPGSVAAAWASLAEAGLKLEAGKADQAQPLFQRVYDEHKGDTALGARALEGLAMSLDASGKSDDALKKLEELKTFAGGTQKDLAEYHIARIKLEKGDRDGAKALLKGLYDRLSERPEGAPPSRYLKGEVEVRLSEIDPSLVDKGTSGGDQQFSQEEIQRLIEQLRQQQGNPPAGGGAE